MSNNVEAIYPLSPMQEGMLFHTAYAPGTGIYVNQVAYTFGGLDADAFRRAWQAALDRHGALRSAFLWEKRDRPLQAVLRAVELPWDERDWRGLDGQAQQAALEALMHEDRTRGFALNRAPATRLYVLRTGDDEHRVLWSFHHLVLDGWSMSLLLGEVFRLYDALRRGETPALPPAPQYRAYITWLQAQRPADAEAFWRGALAGVDAPTPLGVDHAGSAVDPADPDRYAQRSVPIPAATAAAVQAFARRAQLTANTVVQGAWALLLSRYGGSRDVVFGVTMSGRPAALAGAEQTVGLFINTLPARVAVPEEQGVLPWLQDVQRRHAELQQHGHVPLVQVHGWSDVPRDQPLFETVLAFQNFPSERAGRQAGGLQVRDVKVSESPGLPLTLSVGIGTESFLKLMYDRTRISDETAARLPAHFTAALDAIAAGAERLVGELDVLPAGEREQVVHGANGTATEYPRGASIHALFEAQAAATPEAVALCFGTERVTYAQLDARANRVARRLRAMGVRAETRVAVCAERSPEMVAALLGVLKAGGAYVPLDPSYPADRLAFMLGDCDVPVLAAHSALAEALPPHGAAVLRLDADAAEIDSESGEPLALDGDADDAAYVMYTSGSTGRPKGIVVPHRGVVRLVRGANFARMGADEAWLQLAPVSFDASTLEIWAPLLNGGRVVLFPGAQPTLDGLERTVREGGVTSLWLTAGLFNTVVDGRVDALAGVRQLLVGGDVLSVDHVRRVLRAHPGLRVVNGYGPTENTTFTCCHPVRDGDLEAAAIPIGGPVANSTAYVLDAALRPTPQGVPGELYTGGAGVARGYLNQPALTAARFIPDPFSATPGARMYATGDRVRRGDDGTLEFLGRIDRQVKVRGFRIEPGEVEAALRARPGVRDAIVAPRGQGAQKRLLAWVAAGAGVDESTLLAALQAELPAYMVPSAIVVMPELPLNPNGKVDRAALPDPDARAADAHVAPRNELEAELAGLFGEVLSVDGVGATDSFFALGGHSLLAMRLVSRVREKLGVELPLRALFERPTVEEMAWAVEDERRGELAALPPVVPVKRTGPLPLSFAQERLWLVDQMEGAGALYNVAVARRLAGALDVEALRRALAEIVRRHEALRTVFREAEGSLQQVIVPFAGFRVPLEDLSELDEPRREAEAAWHAAQDAARPFDLAEGPLVRARLLRLGGEDHVLLLCVHHVACDGWSMGVLFHELSVLYEAFREGRGSPLPEPAVQYADYAVWQRRHLDGDALEPHLAYWRQALSGAPELLALPADHPRPAVRTYRGAHERAELPAELLERLRALGQGEGATLFMVLLGAFQALLSRYGGGDDVVVGSPIAGRTSRELEGLIGFFANTLVLRTELGGDPAFRDVLRRVRVATLGAYEHQDVPFDRLVAELRPERSLSHSPLFQVMFTLQDADLSAWSLPGLRVSAVGGEAQAKFDLMLTMEATPHGLRAGLTYATDLFEGGTIRRMLGHLERVLEQVAEDADVRLSELNLAGDVERALLAAGHATRAFPVAERLDERFARRALERPDSPALTFEGTTATYGELNERANRLAHRLRALGVGPEVRVGIALERSAELVVAILAVLKAGGGYVPLDPSYPAERIAFVLDDAEIPVLVTASHLVAQLPAFAGATLCIDTDAEAIAAESEENPRVEAGPDSLAYVIYTSGSTGKPKGVQVTHANVARLFDATESWFGFAADDVWTLFHSCAFDFSVWEIWGALLHGGRLVVVPFLTTRSPEDFHRLLVDEGVTMLSQTPSAFKQLVQADLASGVDASALRLRNVVFGGEALDPQSLRPWMERHGDERPRLVNMYGITETTVHVTYRVITRADLDRAGSPIGVPIPDLSLYVLDSRLEPVPPGVPGELFVGGAGVARGYLNRPELNAERFIHDPFSADPEARLYRSGDLARRRADGELEYMGRADQQVKVRGFRIETGEIEAVLLSHPAVAATAVVAREDAGGERRLVAYVVAGPGAAEPTAAELRAHLAAALPDYMVPAAFVPLDVLPLTENGKLDRRALPAPEDVRTAVAADAYRAPSTAAEETLAGIWAEVLGVERVGIDDNYFALGGDSIRGVRLVAAARRRGLTLSIPHIYRHQTVRALAAAAGPADVSPRVAEPAAEPFALLDPAARAGLPADVEDAYPVSQVQLGMLYHTQRDPSSLAYHEVLSYRVHTRFDEAAMREAIARVAARHPILRSSFDLAAVPEPIQRVHRRVEVPLEITDFRELNEDERDEWMEHEKAHGFDWTAAPLLRFRVHLLSEETFRLVMVEHHVLMDGWSVASLMTELLRLYEAVRDGLDDPTGAPPATRFRDFVELERREMASAEPRDFWRRVLDGAEPAALPPREGEDAPRPDDTQYLQVAFPDELAAGLGRVAAAAGVPMKTALLAVHLRVLAMLSGNDDVVTGYVTSGRPETDDSERVLGVFLNTVPLRVRMARGSWLDLVRLTWEAEAALLPHRRFPLSEIVREAGGRAPFEVGFNFVHFHVYGDLAGTGVRLEGDRAFQKTEVPLSASFSMGTATGAVKLRLEHDPARLSEAQVRAIAGWYTRALAALATGPDERWDADALLDSAEEARLRLASAGPVVKHPPLAVHRLFEAQAARTPRAVAVAHGEASLTYAQLDERANRLAHRLVRLGAGPDARVGVYLERGLELVVSLLAVLKAGAAYLPLDPEHPADRVAWMLEDGGARVLLTRAGLAGRTGGWRGEVVALDGVEEHAAAAAPGAPAVEAGAEGLAYVIFTSGSTGRPKGVGVPHRALSNHMQWMQRALPLTAADRVLQKTPVGFDASVWEFWAPLLAGATLVMAPAGAHREPAEMLEAVRREGITVLQLVPAMLREVVEHPALPLCGTLRRLCCGGEALPAELAARARALTGAQVVNLYGPTEVCIQSVVHVDAGEPGVTVPIGQPVDNVRAYVLDGAGAPVPPGVPGELFLGGAQLARGYLGRPGLTAERFVPDPFAGEPGARLYRTGDRARFLADGTLEYLGRVDQQVKVRGFRVEPGEVEAALASHPGVAGCTVQARPDAGGDTRLVAYLVPARGAVLPAGELRAYLRERLPEAMVPSAFVALDAFPLTPSGKVDHRALPAPEGVRAERPYVAPRDTLELRLARLWEEVLNADAVGVRDDFFDLGGHSLAALRLLAAVERLTGVRVPMATLLATPTVENLARALRAGEDHSAHGPLVPIQPAGDERPLFLVHAAGGNVASYAALARHLGPAQPLYGLQARGVEGDEPSPAGIEEMAADYLAQLRTVQEAGPYRLGGWSMGGLVAFEMARMLAAVGEEVELLALVDTRAPSDDAPATDPDGPRLLAGFLLHLGLSPARTALFADEAAALPAGERLRRAWEAARAEDVVPDLDLLRFERLWSVFRANVAAASAYQPGPSATDILLVSAGDRPAPAALEAERWQSLTAGSVRAETLPGDHFGLVREPHVGALAALLADALASVGAVA